MRSIRVWVQLQGCFNRTTTLTSPLLGKGKKGVTSVESVPRVSKEDGAAAGFAMFTTGYYRPRLIAPPRFQRSLLSSDGRILLRDGTHKRHGLFGMQSASPHENHVWTCQPPMSPPNFLSSTFRQIDPMTSSKMPRALTQQSDKVEGESGTSAACTHPSGRVSTDSQHFCKPLIYAQNRIVFYRIRIP